MALRKSKKLGCYMNATGSLKIYPEKLKAVSYNWWNIMLPLGNVIIFNSHFYSPTTARHVRIVEKFKFDTDKPIIEIDCMFNIKDITDLQIYIRDLITNHAYVSGMLKHKDKLTEKRFGILESLEVTYKQQLDALLGHFKITPKAKEEQLARADKQVIQELANIEIAKKGAAKRRKEKYYDIHNQYIWRDGNKHLPERFSIPKAMLKGIKKHYPNIMITRDQIKSNSFPSHLLLTYKDFPLINLDKATKDLNEVLT